MTDKAFILYCHFDEFFKICYTPGERNREYTLHLKECRDPVDFVKPKFPVIIDTDPDFLTLSAVKRMYQKMIERK
ncbi:MAG: hypothetical protein CV087_22980 [Candidatus Brocadia sp. WS118]|nr:MAG: hypothetical protein CV087_22980 [Candidatus Brocadia sp. WS118]